jgi:hypothetical protein
MKDKTKRLRNDPSSLEDWEYEKAVKILGLSRLFGDYSLGQNNCQDLAAEVAGKLTGKSIDLGSIFKPAKSMRTLSRQQVLQSKAAGIHHHRVVHHQQHLHRVAIHHHHR